MSDDESAVEQIMDITDGRGVDYAVELTGSSLAVENEDGCESEG